MDQQDLEQIKAAAVRGGALEPPAAEILQPELRTPSKYTGSPTWGTVANLAAQSGDSDGTT